MASEQSSNENAASLTDVVTDQNVSKSFALENAEDASEKVSRKFIKVNSFNIAFGINIYFGLRFYGNKI